MQVEFAAKAALAASSIAACVNSASAQSTYVAGGSATTEGVGSTSTPLGNGSATNVTSQFLFSTAQLGDLPIGSVITAIGFRINVNSLAPVSALNYSNYQISLGGSTQAVGNLTTNFAANQAAGTAVVRTGALTIPVGSLVSQPFQASPTPTPNPFYTINFTTPFTYTGGNLLLTLSYVTSNTVTTTLDGTPYSAGGVDSASNINPLGTYTQLYSLPVVQFTTQAATAGVPEPATWAMMMLGFGGMGYAMRRRATVGARVRFA